MNDATLITLRNNAGLTLELMDLGAAVRSLAPSWSTSGTADESSVGLGHPQISDYHQTPKGYLGAIVGRYANRIAGGTLPIDGRVHQLKTNEGPNTLHGGPDGFDTRRWEVMQRTSTSATFQLHSPDGDQGFPGAVTAPATYRITTTDHGAADVIDIILTATSDAPTMVNLASHPFFRLAPLGSASDDHLLQVNAERYLPINGDGNPERYPASG
jgi:aldose 1-epimerase